MNLLHAWYSLNRRERLMVGIGGSFALFILGYVLCYAPLKEAVTRKQNILQDKQDTLAWMKRIHIKPTSGIQAKTVTQTQLLTHISTAFKKRPFSAYPYTLMQTSSGDIDLAFKHVPFNTFLIWAWEFNQHYRFEVKQLSVEKTDTPGIVRLRCVIKVT